MVGPLASLLHPEEHVLAQALELGQLLPQLLGGGGVAVLVHPFGPFPEFGRDLVFLLLRHDQLELLLVQLVLDREERSHLLIKKGTETCHAVKEPTCVSKMKASRLLRVFSRSCLATSLSVRSCNLQRHGVSDGPSNGEVQEKLKIDTS